MSGHSKWHQIKHKKAVTDSRKSQRFGRLARDIVIAARGGSDPALNPLLREAVARAKRVNMPQENIDRLLAKKAAQLEEILYEGFGPGGSCLLIQVMTDNPNRTIQELRLLFKEHGGTIGARGSVQWKFTPIVVATISLSEQADQTTLELALIEAGAQDIAVQDQALLVTAPLSARASIQDILTQQKLTEYLQIEYDVASPVSLAEPEAEKLAALQGALTTHPDVLMVFTDHADPVRE